MSKGSRKRQAERRRKALKTLGVYTYEEFKMWFKGHYHSMNGHITQSPNCGTCGLTVDKAVLRFQPYSKGRKYYFDFFSEDGTKIFQAGQTICKNCKIERDANKPATKKEDKGLKTILEASAMDVLNLIKRNLDKPDIVVEGFLVRTSSLRYKTFTRQPKCVCCDRTVTTAKLQYQPSNSMKRAHFNLFSQDGMLMTKDHKVAKSLGGLDHINNMQTMCLKCNNTKGSMTESEWQIYQSKHKLKL